MNFAIQNQPNVRSLKDFKAEVERLQAVQELQESVDNILQEFNFAEEETSELVNKVFEVS